MWLFVWFNFLSDYTFLDFISVIVLIFVLIYFQSNMYIRMLWTISHPSLHNFDNIQYKSSIFRLHYKLVKINMINVTPLHNHLWHKLCRTSDNKYNTTLITSSGGCIVIEHVLVSNLKSSCFKKKSFINVLPVKKTLSARTYH